jgi:TPR repeat protein
MEWSINEDGFLKDQALNKEAIRWLNKSIEVSDSTDYKSLYWLSVYHYYGVSVKEDTKLFLKLLNKAMMEAQKNNDPVFTDKINKTLQDFN